MALGGCARYQVTLNEQPIYSPPPLYSQFEVADESIKQERIAGLFKAGDVDGLLAALEQNFNIHNQRMGNNKIRLSAK